MAYLIEESVYECDICGFESKWDDYDEKNGELWGCENCGTTFCSKCFIDRHGQKQYIDMMKGSDLIYCPDCYEKIERSIWCLASR